MRGKETAVSVEFSFNKNANRSEPLCYIFKRKILHNDVSFPCPREAPRRARGEAELSRTEMAGFDERSEEKVGRRTGEQ